MTKKTKITLKIQGVTRIIITPIPLTSAELIRHFNSLLVSAGWDQDQIKKAIEDIHHDH